MWENYLNVRDSQSAEEKLPVLIECAKQEEDIALTRVARYDLGYMYYQGQGLPQDKERGKSLMKSAANLGYGPAMNLYGQMLSHDGDWEAFDYITKSLASGEIIAAKNLHKLSQSSNPDIVECINNHMEQMVKECRDKIAAGDDQDGVPQLALALAGLYDLAGKQGISREMGKMYLQQSVDKGNGNADFLLRSPDLQGPGAEEVSAAPAKTDAPEKEEIKTSPFGLSDVLFGLGCGLVGGFIINLIFHTGFFIPFIVISIIMIGIMFLGSSKES